MDYKWAANKLKLTRAIQVAKTQNIDDEDGIKEIYTNLGGKVLDVPKRPGRPAKHDKDTTVDSEE